MLSYVCGLAASAAAGSSDSASVSAQGVTGLVIRTELLTAVPAVSVKAELFTTEGSEVIIPNLPLLFLAERSDFKGGSSYGARFSVANSTAGASETEDLEPTATFVDIGHYDLSGDDELTITLTATSAIPASAAVRCSVIDLPGRRENPLKFVEKPTGTANFSFPREVWAYRTATDTEEDAVAETTAGVTTFVTKSGNKERSSDVVDLWAATAALGRFEMDGPRRLVMLYLEPDQVQGDGSFSATVQGTDKANWTIIGVERLLMPRRASQKAATSRAKRESNANSIAARDPEAYRALLAAGKL